MRIGLDIDGVLADFQSPYQALIVKTTGKDLFHDGDDRNPPVWEWPQLRGYTNDEIKAIWALIKQSRTFWYSLPPTPHLATLALMIYELEHKHDVYYVTARVGESAKRQTEAWLTEYLPYNRTGVYPTVLVSSHKGAIANALNFDCYIDDNGDNALDVASTSLTRSYLLNRPYNRGMILPGVTRVDSLGEFFDVELANL